MSKFDVYADMPVREHTFEPVEVSGRLMVNDRFGGIELVADDGISYKLAKKKDAPLGGIRYYKQGDDVNKFTAIIGQEVVMKGVLDTFQDYGTGLTTIRVIRGPKVVTADE